MKTNGFMALALVVGSSGITYVQSPPVTAATKPESELISDIAKDGMLEVQLGKIAEHKATNPDVKAFAKHMVKDHSDANEKLKNAARQDNVDIPKELSTAQQDKKDQLKSCAGAEFDRKYMEAMVAGHKKAVEAVTKETKIGSGNLKTWAENTLPVIEGHKKDAEGINAKLAQK